MLLVSDELLDAVEAGDLERAAALLREGASPHEDSCGFGLLDEALTRHAERMARLLVKRGARLDETDARGLTRLHRAASGANDADAVAFLLRLGLDPNAADREGWTALHHAAAHGHRRVVAALIEAGADRDARTTHGKRAADVAAVNGHERLPLRVL
jgi:ankyrin repeat protein